jgi:streptomycin 6-kinase
MTNILQNPRKPGRTSRQRNLSQRAPGSQGIRLFQHLLAAKYGMGSATWNYSCGERVYCCDCTLSKEAGYGLEMYLLKRSGVNLRRVGV